MNDDSSESGNGPSVAAPSANACSGTTRRQFRTGLAALCLTLLAACASTSGERQFRFFDEAKLLGHEGFVAIVTGEGDAHASFEKSSEVLSKGIKRYVNKVERGAFWREVGSMLLMVGAATAGTGAAVQGNRKQVEDMNRIIANQPAREASIQRWKAGKKLRVDGVDMSMWRVPLVTEHPYSESVVRINSNTGSCTGFFIQPRVVATAAHCFKAGDETVTVHHERMDSANNFLRGVTSANPVVASIRHPLFESGQCGLKIPEGCISYDIALLVTARANRYHLPVGALPAQRELVLAAIGYSGDKNQGFFKQLDYGCKPRSVLEDALGKVVSTDCEIYKGNSGGPLLAIAPRKGQPPQVAVVGIASGAVLNLDQATRSNLASYAYLPAGRALYRKLVDAYPDAGDPALFNDAVMADAGEPRARGEPRQSGG